MFCFFPPLFTGSTTPDLRRFPAILTVTILIAFLFCCTGNKIMYLDIGILFVRAFVVISRYCLQLLFNSYMLFQRHEKKNSEKYYYSCNNKKKHIFHAQNFTAKNGHQNTRRHNDRFSSYRRTGVTLFWLGFLLNQDFLRR